MNHWRMLAAKSDTCVVFEKSASHAAELKAAHAATNTSPSHNQIAAGNYAKGSCRIHGLSIKVENPKGSVRSGVDDNGKKWSNKMKATYGYFTGTRAADGDAVDVFIGPDIDDEFVAVVDQYKGRKFDESKVILGCRTKCQATSLYLAHFPPNWELGPVSTCTTHQLKRWLRDGDHKKPFAGQMLKAAYAGTPAHNALQPALPPPVPSFTPQPVPASPTVARPQPGVYTQPDGSVFVRPLHAPNETEEQGRQKAFDAWYPGYLKREGPGVTHDSGGYTVAGVAESSGLSKAKIKSMSPADIRNYYQSEYNKLSGIKDHAVRNAMMETGMNSGPKLAPGALQRTLGMKPDGVLGSRTTAAVNAMEPTTAIGAVLGAWRDKHRALQATGLVKYDQAHTAGWPDRRRQFADTMPANTAPEATSIPPVTSR